MSPGEVDLSQQLNCAPFPTRTRELTEFEKIQVFSSGVRSLQSLLQLVVRK